MEYGKLKTEQRNERSTHIDKMPTVDMMRCINNDDKLVPLAVEKEIPNIAAAVDAIAAGFEKGGRLIYTGAGTSGRLGVLDASECPPTYGTDPSQVVGVIAGGDYALRLAIEGAEDDEDAGRAAMAELKIGEHDVVVGISAAGGAAYVLGTLRYANEHGAVSVGITCNPDGALLKDCKIAITPVVGAEVVTGSSRMKAGTAQKLVLNMLSTGAMIKTGKVYENLMINMKPTNIKLQNRAKRIISQITGVSTETAGVALESCGNDIRAAIDSIKSEH